VPLTLDRFYTEYQKAFDEGVAAAFVGAGMSMPSGFVNWRELLRDIAADLGLDIDKETDLIALAQYHVNHARSRGYLSQKLVDEFTRAAAPSRNHRLLAAMPFGCVWTTNYDHLIEEAFEAAHKRVDKKVQHLDLAITRSKRDVVVYKMHGDVDRPDEAVLTKSDYERYDEQRSLFSEQLRGDLLSKTFLFLGFSFTDPNIGYILGRLRSLVGKNARRHYWVTRDAGTDPSAASDDLARQRHRVEDLKTYGIQTILLNDYGQVTSLLEERSRRVHRRNVFISGSAVDYAPFGEPRVRRLVRTLGATLINQGFNIVCGMGLGIGDSVAIGAVEAVYREATSRLDERTHLRPFPQVESADPNRAATWTRFRHEMVSRARFAVFLLGNKFDATGAVAPADGVREEYKIARELGVYPIPIGATGHVAAVLLREVLGDINAAYGCLAPKVRPHLEALGGAAATDAEIMGAVASILHAVAPN
jgi:hypothetical protein